MKKVLLVYLPFCTPASPPYSITNLYSFLKNNYEGEVDVLDLNLEFHKIKFPEYQKYYKDVKQWKNYEEMTAEYIRITSKVYSENNKKVVNNEDPELLQEMIDKINERKADVVAFSIVYSSQAFFASAILKKLKNVTTVIGGPAVNEKLVNVADKTLNSEIELLEFLDPNKKELNFDYAADYSKYDLTEYFTPEVVIPIKTTSGCYYGQCAFCSHHRNAKYVEYPLDIIKQGMINSKQKYFFLIDDMIHVKRLLEFAEIIKPLNVKWACQLKPKKEFTYDVLKTLEESGLNLIMWGVESGNDRILTLMKKDTNVKDVEAVLRDSKKSGIRNIAYIMFGFPSETKDEFLDTIKLLTRNKDNIDLVSVSIFGLQKGTPIYKNPEKYCITKIIEENRTVLEPKITYEVESGLSNEEAGTLRKNYRKTIERINKYPKQMNFFREHMCVLDRWDFDKH